MRRSLFLLLAMLGLVASMAASCPVAPAPPAEHVHNLNPPGIEISDESAKVVTLINAQRASAGCGEVEVNNSMVAFADAQAKFMNNGGGFVHSRLGPPILAENISQGYTTAQEVVNAWLDSSAHKANIVNCDYTKTGVAFAGDFAVQVFG